MEAAQKKSNLMTEGSIGKQIFFFSVPLILGNLLQQLYNTADSIIVGNFVGSNALAAGGSTLAEAVVDTVMAPVILFLIQAVCFLVIFSIISLVFRFLVSLGRGVNHIPVVGQLNQLLGLGVGVVKAAIEGYIAVLLLMLIVGLTKGSLDFLNYQVLEDTVLIRWIAGWPLPF